MKSNKVKLLKVFFAIILPLVLIANLFLFPFPSWAKDVKAMEQSKDLIVVAGSVKVKPDKREDFIALSKTFIEPSRSEPGSISYSFYEDETEKNNFLFFELWKDRAALDYHFQTPYFHEFVEKSPDLLAKPAQIKIYTIAETQTL
jgi:quinol monooxygenase YgiN